MTTELIQLILVISHILTYSIGVYLGYWMGKEKNK